MSYLITGEIEVIILVAVKARIFRDNFIFPVPRINILAPRGASIDPTPVANRVHTIQTGIMPNFCRKTFGVPPFLFFAISPLQTDCRPSTLYGQMRQARVHAPVSNSVPQLGSLASSGSKFCHHEVRTYIHTHTCNWSLRIT